MPRRRASTRRPAPPKRRCSRAVAGAGTLRGKVVAVTGGGRGIGRACALFCAAEGARVVVNDRGVARDGSGDDPAPAQETVAAIVAAGGSAIANAASVTEPGGADGIIADALHHFGRIDAVIHAAGFLRDAIWHRMTRADWDAVIDVHLNAAFAICQSATPHFRAQGGGSFVLFTSGAGLVGNVGQANYSAAKLGVVGLMQSIALDMARHGVRANAIAPVALTRMVGEAPALAHLTAEKIAPVAAWLAGDSSAPLTNQVFGVSGDEVTLFSRPRPVARLTSEGGWTPALLAERVPDAFAGALAGAFETAVDTFAAPPGANLRRP
ncbi:MAG: SDR family NAD(P)-dependent oxidoreductase [Sphingomonadales bacterium]|nr:SDR family NAD(P)-dependent oxidoreductase [Sphingomonadales bacterium]